jgi:hypothetical protein
MLKKPFRPSRNTFALLWLVLPVIVVALINRFAQQPISDDPLKQIEIYQGNSNPEKAEIILIHLLDEKPLDLDLNYRTIPLTIPALPWGYLYQTFYNINGYAAGYALLICGIWFIYLWRIDLYTK